MRGRFDPVPLRKTWRLHLYFTNRPRLLNSAKQKSQLSFVVLGYYGAARVPKESTAYPHRDLPCDILFVAQWTEAAETTVHRDWARSGEELLRPFSANAHLVSALDVESEEVINTAFVRNPPRLAAVKEKYDPANFFRVNHSIKPGLRPSGVA